jgi:predicted GTPase
MILGFEEYTKELTDDEKNVLLPLIVRRIRYQIGKTNAVKNKTIVKSLKNAGYKISGARFRKIIHIIRVSGMVEGIVATSDGYYIAATEEEWLKYLISISQRIKHIDDLRSALRRQYKKWKIKNL